jgi:hypothetical protein
VALPTLECNIFFLSYRHFPVPVIMSGFRKTVSHIMPKGIAKSKYNIGLTPYADNSVISLRIGKLGFQDFDAF